MGYFSNGTEGMAYASEYCDHCIHADEEHGCPCWEAHNLWNYDECNNKDSILHKMIPRKDGRNGQCIFYRPVSHQEDADRMNDCTHEWAYVGKAVVRDAMLCPHCDSVKSRR